MVNTTTDARTAFLLVAVVAAAAVLVQARLVYACGHCHGDKVAAVYDHAAIAKAKREGKHVAYVEFIGSIPDTVLTRDAIRRAVASLPTVDKASIRVSSNPAAAAFAFVPGEHDATSLAAALARKDGITPWTVNVLQVLK